MVRKRSKLSQFTAKLSTPRGVIYVLVASIAIVSLLELSNATNFLLKERATSGIIPTSANPEHPTPPEDKSSGVPSSSTPSSETPKQEASPAPSPSGAAPITPYGNFVSNHHPNLDGIPAPSSVSSVCNTTPGASCHIEFTNQDGVVKKLAAQKTDTNGATYWNWDVNQAGFTVGAWEIKAVATLNGKTSPAKDVQKLEVGP